MKRMHTSAIGAFQAITKINPTPFRNGDRGLSRGASDMRELDRLEHISDESAHIWQFEL